MRLEAEETSAFQISSADEVDGWVKRLSYTRPPGDMTLTAESGDYIQAAGSGLRITVELRMHQSSGFRHFVIGRRPEDQRLIGINTRAGIITVQRHEVLSNDEVRELFREFILGGVVLESWNLRDVTDRFASS